MHKKDPSMEKIIINGPQKKEKLHTLLEGYLYGLGEVCHSLFGAKGEIAMYSAIGSYFLSYLKRHMGIAFLEQDPWERLRHIIEVFTSYGFYSRVEMEQLAPDAFWMLEVGQYATDVWEEQRSWERGTPPCPLWSITLHSLSTINYTIVLDSVEYDKRSHGYESTFHFEKVKGQDKDVIEHAKKTIRSVLIPICSNCKKIREDNGNWMDNDHYFAKNFHANFSHSICPACYKKLYPKIWSDNGQSD
jgi:hypothetical protein